MEEAENVIRKLLAELKNPDLGGATCSPTFLLGRTKSSLDIIDSVTENFSVYNNDPSAMGKALSSLSSYTHSMSEVVLLGVATSHLAPAEEGKSELVLWFCFWCKFDWYVTHLTFDENGYTLCLLKAKLLYYNFNNFSNLTKNGML